MEPTQPPPWKLGLVNGVIYGDPYTYHGGTTAEALRSGEDGPFFYEAEVMCGLSPRTYERFSA